MAVSRAMTMIDAELEVNRRVLAHVQHRIDELERQAKRARIPAKPMETMLSVSLQFEEYGPFYRFLILGVPGKGYYTTGVKPENQFFATWAALWEYLDGIEVFARTALVSVTMGSEIIPRRAG